MRLTDVGSDAAAAPARMPGQTCDEAAARCVTRCPLGTDADGDGHRARECGGDDCDANRFPSNVEVCDSASHDEDCDFNTFGVRDLDMDSYQTTAVAISTALPCIAGETAMTLSPTCTLDCWRSVMVSTTTAMG